LCIFTHTSTSELYSLSLHDALPISRRAGDGLIGTHHVLQAIFDDTQSLAALVLTALGVTVQAVADKIAEIGVAGTTDADNADTRSEEHTSELQSRSDLVCRLLLEKK